MPNISSDFFPPTIGSAACLAALAAFSAACLACFSAFLRALLEGSVTVPLSAMIADSKKIESAGRWWFYKEVEAIEGVTLY